jgi:hypothetical protein
MLSLALSIGKSHESTIRMRALFVFVSWQKHAQSKPAFLFLPACGFLSTRRGHSDHNFDNRGLEYSSSRLGQDSQSQFRKTGISLLALVLSLNITRTALGSCPYAPGRNVRAGVDAGRSSIIHLLRSIHISKSSLLNKLDWF